MQSGFSWTQSDLGTSPKLSPSAFIRAGFYLNDTGKVSGQGSYAYYLEQRGSGETNSTILNFDKTTISPKTSWAKGRGLSLRCLGR